MSGTLYLVATPIGNLEDITLRALRILKQVALVACEDTRQTKKLLQHYQIATPTISYHDHNEQERTPQLLARLQNGESIALVSDAGTPMLSDPGHTLVAAAIQAQIPLVALPGASALLTALVCAGLPTETFMFIGFLPAKAGERRKHLKELVDQQTTLIFYEAPHRIIPMLTDALEILGNCNAVVARELTKIYEEFRRGKLATLLEQLQTTPPRGELVVLIDSRSQPIKSVEITSLDMAITAKMADEQLDRMAALKAIARTLGISKSEAYRRWQAELSENSEV